MNTYILSKEEGERLNILKNIAIIVVVYIHSYATNVNFADGTNMLFLPQWLLIFENLISQTIARCGVPLFCLISSLLLFKKRRDYKETVKSKIRTLLVPYFIWNSFWILAFILLQNLSFTSAYFSGENTLLGRDFEQMTIPAKDTYGTMKGMGDRNAYAIDFKQNSKILQEFLYGTKE